MANNGIVPVKLSLTKGDFYTLWAPSWREHGAEWQAFLGAGDDLFVFHSPAELLVFLESDEKHDLQSHPKWGAFSARDTLRAVPAEKEEFDLVGVPAFLADKPSSSNVKAVARCFRIARRCGRIDTYSGVFLITFYFGKCRTRIGTLYRAGGYVRMDRNWPGGSRQLGFSD